MHYEIVFKVIGGVHVILASLKSSSAAQTALKMASGTGTDAPPVAQRLLTNTWPKQCTIISRQANSNKKLKNSTPIHENSAQNYPRTILRVTTIAWT